MNKEKIILHVGRLNITQKRSDLLLKFWQETYKKLPEWEFIIVGEGPYSKFLKDDIEKSKIPRIRLDGFRNPQSYYKKATIFMMPSAYEGFPNTILEAHSFGCIPLAFSSYAALDWIVSDGQDAFLSKPFDIKDMSKNAIQLAMDNEMQLKMCQKSLQNAENFTIDKVGDKWINLFNELI